MAPSPGLTGPSRRAPWSALGPIRLGLLALALVALAGVPMGWSLTRPSGAMGSPPPMPTPMANGVVVNVTAPQVPPIAIYSGRLADQAAIRSGPSPVLIQFPSLATHAAVVPVGVQRPSSSIQIPPDVDVVGWYRFSSVPGRPGSSVLVGHVDSAVQGPGAFFQLQELRMGSRVVVKLRDGGVLRFRVAARRMYPKNDLPRLIYRRFGPPMLALVTCGGAFDSATHHYSENVVVFAVPVS